MYEQRLQTLPSRSAVEAALERSLIWHCAPVLAGLRPASMVCLPLDAAGEMEHCLEKLAQEFAGSGLYLTVLRRREGRMLLYLCRRAGMEALLAVPELRRFLERYGYAPELDLDGALERLRRRLGEEEEFPHEIGVFLGYPLGDVEGFIRNGGRHCACAGCWKVYCNVQETQRLFARFQRCREVYCRLWRQGRSLRQLTVAA